MSRIILLSGPIASGKTTLAEELVHRHGFERLKSSDHLKAACVAEGSEISRSSLQRVGDDLDMKTDYRWLVSDVAIPQIALAPAQKRWLIDAVRKERQIEHFRAAFSSGVLHVHIWAPEEVLRARYEKRLAAGGVQEGSTTYSEAIEHANEIASRALKGQADLAINVDRASPAAISDAIASLMS